MRNKRTLDSIAREYDPSKDFDRFAIEYERTLIVQNAVGKSLLEIGCADGTMTEYFARHMKVVEAVDGSSYYLRKAEKRCKGLNVIFRNSLIEDFSARSKYDNIVMVRLLEHLNDPVLVLRRASKWLTENGLLHIVVPNGHSLHRRLGVVMGILSSVTEFSERDKAYGHRRVYIKESLFSDLKRAGLKIIHSEGVLLKPLPNAQMEKWDKKIIHALLEVGKELPDWCAEFYVKAECN
jgi:2-polyprenyl-3-methyl-5-hydroxy-6-metoxy-1,4-benzoquinol methylase